ncbi:MAG TPA: hypothetical protein VI603_02100 [Saprospiraceae bacterium]|nr:hypothetical protein [Saprospiraceae bacterium]
MRVLNDEFLQFLKCAQTTGLRYLLIGGYAVNYHGYNRNTDDMDIWLAPTNENKEAFVNTLLCMNYSSDDVTPLYNEDFTSYFMGRIGPEDSRIDVLTIVHRNIAFEDAYKQAHTFEITPGVFMKIVSYETLKDIKLRSDRQKDWYDIDMLEKLRKVK